MRNFLNTAAKRRHAFADYRLIYLGVLIGGRNSIFVLGVFSSLHLPDFETLYKTLQNSFL